MSDRVLALVALGCFLDLIVSIARGNPLRFVIAMFSYVIATEWLRYRRSSKHETPASRDG